MVGVENAERMGTESMRADGRDHATNDVPVRLWKVVAPRNHSIRQALTTNTYSKN